MLDQLVAIILKLLILLLAVFALTFHVNRKKFYFLPLLFTCTQITDLEFKVFVVFLIRFQF